MVNFGLIRYDYVKETIAKCEEIESENPYVEHWYVAPIEKSYDFDGADCTSENKSGRMVSNDNVFCRHVVRKYGLFTHNKAYYSKVANVPRIGGGQEGDEIIKSIISMELERLGITTNVSVKVNNLANAMKWVLRENKEEVEYPKPNKEAPYNEYIPFANGNYYPTYKIFIQNDPRPVLFRFNYKLPNYFTETPTFDYWLDTLFEEDDKPVIQQYCGYCLQPTSKGQRTLMMFGDADMGKSRIVTFMKAIMGDCAEAFSVTNFLNNRFDKVKAINKLLLFDDDISEASLSDNNDFKTLITNNGTLWYEHKGKDAFQGEFFARLMLIGNRDLSLPKNADNGYIRRLLPVVCKPKPSNFVKDTDFDEKLLNEIDGITNWVLKGLLDFKANNYNFENIMSPRTLEYLEALREDTDTFTSYFKNCYEVTYEEEDFVSNKDYIDGYKAYIKNNGGSYNYDSINNDLKKWLRENYQKLGLEKGKQGDSRGYVGLKLRGE